MVNLGEGGQTFAKLPKIYKFLLHEYVMDDQRVSGYIENNGEVEKELTTFGFFNVHTTEAGAISAFKEEVLNCVKSIRNEIEYLGRKEKALYVWKTGIILRSTGQKGD